MKFVSIIMILLLLTIFMYQSDWYEIIISGDFDSIVRKNVWSILAITLMMMIIQNTFTMIPLILVISINYVLFGFINGFLWSWFTSLIGAAIIFIATRNLFQDWVIQKVDPRLLDKIEQKGGIFVFQARIIPFIPTSLINIIGGVSSVKFKSFMLATAFGNFLYFFIMILIPAGLINIQLNKYILEGVILIVILVLFIVRFIGRRKPNNPEHHVYDEETINHK